MYSWMNEQSLLDLKFDPKMPKGYSKPNPRTGFTKDKEVWSHKFFHQVEEELTRKDGLGVLDLVWKFKDEYLMLSRHCRNSFLSKGTYFYCSIRMRLVFCHSFLQVSVCVQVCMRTICPRSTRKIISSPSDEPSLPKIQNRNRRGWHNSNRCTRNRRCRRVHTYMAYIYGIHT